MKVLADTSVWSLALRRKHPPQNPFVAELSELIREARVRMIGPVRQELLSGIPSRSQFEALSTRSQAPAWECTPGKLLLAVSREAELPSQGSQA